MTTPPAAPRDVVQWALTGIVAQQCQSAGPCEHPPCDCAVEAMHVVFEKLAAAGLAVVPVVATDGMLEAGWAHTGDPCWKENVAQAWAVMIAAAQEGE